MVRVRIAPSPTGDPHVGTAYIALFNAVFAKQHQGEFVLRIEDTDQTRSRPEWENMILEALQWLGMKWDEGPDIGGPYGPYRQSERKDIYALHAKKLIEQGDAYFCFCPPERLTEIREEQRKQKSSILGYDGHCRHLAVDEIEAKLADKVPHVVRLKISRPGQTQVKDLLRDAVEFDHNQIDDQVLLKSDGLPTYHLANVVDDHLMKITHVIRAEEWLTSTPKHVLLYKAFGWEAPEWIHMPLLRNKDRSKISKRKNPVSINYYRDAGYLPEALLNYVAMMGWTMPDGQEQFTVSDMIKFFSFERISLGGPVFDVTKLTWLNGLYLREQSPEKFIDKLLEQVFNRDRLLALAPLLQPRIEKYDEFVEKASYFFCGELSYDAQLMEKMIPSKRSNKEIKNVFQQVLDLIDGLPKLQAEILEEKIRTLLEEIQWKPKELFMPLRLALTGSKATPPLFDTMAILGKERCRQRLRQALTWLKQKK